MRVYPLILVLAAPAFAASDTDRITVPKPNEIVFDATQGIPTTEVELEGQKLRFALDPLLGAHLAINPATARKLELKPIANFAVKAGIDDVVISAKVARVALSVGGRTTNVFGAMTGRAHWSTGDSEHYDIAGGFEALPAKRVIVHLNHGLAGPMREYTFTRPHRDNASGFPVSVTDTKVRLNVHFSHPATWLDRRAAQMLTDEGRIAPYGPVAKIPVWFGLKLPVQDIKSTRPLTANDFVLVGLQARTRSPLALPPEFPGIVVSNLKEDERLPEVLVGTDSLKHCARMVFDRDKRRLTLLCQERPTA